MTEQSHLLCNKNTPFSVDVRMWNNKAFSASFSALDTIMIKREPLQLLRWSFTFYLSATADLPWPHGLSIRGAPKAPGTDKSINTATPSAVPWIHKKSKVFYEGAKPSVTEVLQGFRFFSGETNSFRAHASKASRELALRSWTPTVRSLWLLEGDFLHSVWGFRLRPLAFVSKILRCLKRWIIIH